MIRRGRHTLFATLLATLTLLATTIADAADRYSGVKLTRGTVYSVGLAYPNGNPDNGKELDGGIFFDANYTSVLVNAGLGVKDFDGHRVANLYAGFGFSRLIQVQVGVGDRGPVGRIRTDLNVREVYNFVTRTHQPRREKTLADRATFTYAIERYSDKDSDEFDNGTLGIGVLYEGPF